MLFALMGGTAKDIKAYSTADTELYSRKLSREVYFYDGASHAQAEAGFAENGVVYINKNAPSNRNSVAVVLAHEYVHTIEGTKAYDTLAKAVFGSNSYKEMLRSKGLTQNEYLQQIAVAYKNAPNVDPKKEAVAMYLSEYVFQNEQHLFDLARTDRNAFQAMHEQIRRYIARLCGESQNKLDLIKLERLFAKAAKAANKATQTQKSPADGSGVQYAFIGINKHGIEVFETSEEIKRLSVKERQKVFLDIMKTKYRGRTARLVRNGHAYYALFEEADVRKNIYGDNKSSSKGHVAKVTVGAEGDIFDLVENSKYNRSKAESGKPTEAHKNVGYWDYFIKTVQINGTVFDLIANVRKRNDGRFVYSIQLNENKKIEASPSLSPNKRASNRMLNASNNKIAQNAPVVNTQSMQSNTKNSQGTPSSIPFGFSMGEIAGPLTPAQSQEHALIKLHNHITRILEQRHALENAPPHHVPILQNLMQELDNLKTALSTYVDLDKDKSDNSIQTSTVADIDTNKAEIYNNSNQSYNFGGSEENIRKARALQLIKNSIQGRAFEKRMFSSLCEVADNCVEQITIVTAKGTRIRVDAMATDRYTNQIIIQEYKSSETAPLTNNQEIGFDELKKYGGVIVGKGKGDVFKGGKIIVPGTNVDIIRPSTIQIDANRSHGKVELDVLPKQFGKKIGKHAEDYGLNPSSEADRRLMLQMIQDIVTNAEEIRIGFWRGQQDEVMFFVKKDDVVITKQSGEFVTIMKGGVNNERVKNARKHKI